MNRRTILIFALASIVALFLGAVLLLLASATHANLASAAFGSLTALFLIGGLLGFVAWLLGLAHTAGMHRWDWFIIVLVLGPLGAALYGLLGGEGQTAA